MKNILLLMTLLVGMSTYGQYGLNIKVEPSTPNVEDLVYCIINSNPISGECSFEIDSVEISDSVINIRGNFDSNCKCMADGICDTIRIGTLPQGKYLLVFTITDRHSFIGNDTCMVSFEVTDANSIQQGESHIFSFQNTPNPFSHETEIKYYVPENADNAVLYVFSLQGNMLLAKPVSQLGNGSIAISASELQPGMYIYTLAVDGQEADSKRMIITEE